MPEARRPSGLFITELMEAGFGPDWNRPVDPAAMWLSPTLLEPGYRQALARELRTAVPARHAFVTDALKGDIAERLAAELTQGGGKALEAFTAFLKSPASQAWHGRLWECEAKDVTAAAGAPTRSGGLVGAWLLERGAGPALEWSVPSAPPVTVPAFFNALFLFDAEAGEVRWHTQSVVTVRLAKG